MHRIVQKSRIHTYMYQKCCISFFISYTHSPSSSSSLSLSHTPSSSPSHSSSSTQLPFSPLLHPLLIYLLLTSHFPFPLHFPCISHFISCIFSFLFFLSIPISLYLSLSSLCNSNAFLTSSPSISLSPSPSPSFLFPFSLSSVFSLLPLLALYHNYMYTSNSLIAKALILFGMTYLRHIWLSV